MTATRADVVRVARSYLGTPFRHQGRMPGEYLDCGGVLVCASRDLGLVEADFDVTGYARTPDGESLIARSDEHMTRVSREAMQPGDAVVIRWGRYPQHFGILGDYVHGGLSIIHAYCNADGIGKVIEHQFDDLMRRRFVAAYSLPGVV